MTPLAHYFARLLPRSLVAPALAVAYAAMLFTVLVTGDARKSDIIYIDVKGK